MSKKTILLLSGLVLYVASYVFLRSYVALHAPYAWNRGYETGNPTPSTIHYPIFSVRDPSFLQRVEQKYLRPLAYYVFSPLVEGDLSIYNHPSSPLPRWYFYGNNWPK
jgi:hypothetical protein